VLFASTASLINTLSAAHASNCLDEALKRYISPSLLILDEIGFMPIDKYGSDLLFQVVSQRYEKGSTIVTTNKVFKDWAHIFNNDSVITAAVLDRLLHHVETVVIEGKSYRMKD
jgi:DNA replication protein DnaC